MPNKWLPPDEPSQRRVIMILPRRQLKAFTEKAEKNSKIEDFLYSNSQLSLIDLESAQEESENKVIISLKESGLLNNDSVLIQDPIRPDYGYVRIEDAQYSIAVNKYTYIAHYFLALGAEHVVIKRIELLDSKEELSLQTSIEPGSAVKNLKKIPKATLDVQSRVTRRMQNEFQLNMGSIKLKQPRTDSEIANMLTRLKYVGEYPLLAEFIANRPTSGKIKFTIKATREVKRNIEIAASLSIPEIVGINSKIKTAAEESFSFLLQIGAYFPGSDPKDDKDNI